jgi:outer membrane immunogenic protein
MKMRLSGKMRLLGSVALPALLAAPAMAADLPVKVAPPPIEAFSWTGFYAGVNAGGAWGRSDATTNASCTPTGSLGGYFCDARFAAPGGGQANGAAISSIGTGGASAHGFTGGIQVGHLWQYGRFVYGLEADVESFKLRASRQGSGVYPVGFIATAGNSYTIADSADTDWLFTVRGRVGWAFSNLLTYVTGGLAGTRLNVSNSFSDAFVPSIPAPVRALGAGSGSTNKLGWTVGGGAEWAFSRNWSVRAEYLHVHFDSASAVAIVGIPGPSTAAYSNAIGTSADLTAHIARVGVNFRF